ncbi:unnamed protein product [Microthlaspi erraticum]|uniref:Uncharacterized protein n=1 Tax=Microthlaspi erraticum TaxID=1685480 RepID=A0A6D2JXY1_9BRAS|nr:unnamed protein product [Microthlaspi erraticum]
MMKVLIQMRQWLNKEMRMLMMEMMLLRMQVMVVMTTGLAVGRDADNRMYPIAWALLEVRIKTLGVVY